MMRLPAQPLAAELDPTGCRLQPPPRKPGQPSSSARAARIGPWIANNDLFASQSLPAPIVASASARARPSDPPIS